MNFRDNIIPTGRSPKRELQLQGPRPTPLRINKDSHKIKKPPLPPQPSQVPPRRPVIIYTVSPKIIHTTPSDFMGLVQRLTGSSSSSSSSSSSNKVSSTDPPNGNIGHGTTSSVTIETDRAPQEIKRHQSGNSGDDARVEVSQVTDHGVERPSMFHGILSPPPPASMSLIPSSFFSPPPPLDPSMVSFLHDLSPVLHGNGNFMEGNFVMPSPSNFVSPHTPSIDLFNHFSNYRI